MANIQGYVRMIVSPDGRKGFIQDHFVLNAHLDFESDIVTEEILNQINVKDALVWVSFGHNVDLSGFSYHGDADESFPVIDTHILAPNYKEQWKKWIQHLLAVQMVHSSSSLMPLETWGIEMEVKDWEEFYEEDFPEVEPKHALELANNYVIVGGER